jgi:hypothetical protein
MNNRHDLNPRHAASGGDASSAPWWRFKIMWIVVGAPCFVVVAAIVTAVIAFRGADPVLTVVPTSAEVARYNAEQRSLAPANQARNHTATASGR